MHTIRLTDDEKLVFFELLNKVEDALGETENPIDLAEKKMLSDIITSMEAHIDEIFSPNYNELISEAKIKVLAS